MSQEWLLLVFAGLSWVIFPIGMAYSCYKQDIEWRDGHSHGEHDKAEGYKHAA